MKDICKHQIFFFFFETQVTLNCFWGNSRFDFHYLVHVLICFYLYFYPNSTLLFNAIFCLSWGPTFWEVIFSKRSSLVLHDLDKLTSVFLVVYPSLVTFSLRWYPHSNFQTCSPSGCTLPLSNWIKVPFYIYFFWQSTYFLKTEYNVKESEPKPTTTYRSFYYGSNRYGSSISSLEQFAQFLHSNWATVLSPVVCFMALQQIYFFVTLIPVYFIYHYYYVSLVFLLGLIWTVIWKGAFFYFSIFLRTYSDRLKRFQTDAHEDIRHSGVMMEMMKEKKN